MSSRPNAARVSVAAWVLGGLGFVGAASAQVTIPQEYGKTIKTAEAIGALGDNLFGEQVNFYTGSTTFVVTDVSLPGNNALPVQVGRRLVVGGQERGVPFIYDMFHYWDLDIPHLSGVFAQSTGWAVQNLIVGQPQGDPNQRCSAGGLGQPPTTEGHNNFGIWYPNEYWQGYQMHIPGGGSQELLRLTTNPNKPTDGQTYKWVTADHWVLSCLPQTANGYPGEGFLATSPQGVKYHFDWFVTRPAADITKAIGSLTETSAGQSPSPSEDTMNATFAPVGNSTLLSRVEVWALPTRVEDRFGNYVTYTYDPANPWRLQLIQASDGRALTIAHDATTGRITSVTDGTRTWTYNYGTNFEVTQPDGAKWIYAIPDPRGAYTETSSSGSSGSYCGSAASAGIAQPIFTATITHPSGAVGTFQFQSRVHGRSYVQKLCVRPDPNSAADYAKYPYLFDAVGLIDKTITGVGLPSSMKWTYTYGPTNHSWAENCPNENCTGTKVVEVTGPGEWTRYTFSNRWQHSEGKLLKVEQGAGPASILKTETTAYLLDPTGQRYPTSIGVNPYERGDRTTVVPAPVIKRQILQQGRYFTWEVGAVGGVYDFDHFARPTKARRFSASTP